MNTSLVHVELPLEEAPHPLTQAQAMSQAQDVLRQMVLDTVPSVNSKRNYAKALDDLFVFCASRPLSRALLMEYRTTLQKGQLIALEGTLRYREYEDDVHGLTVRHRIAEIHASSMKRLSKIEAADDPSDGAGEE